MDNEKHLNDQQEPINPGLPQNGENNQPKAEKKATTGNQNVTNPNLLARQINYVSSSPTLDMRIPTQSELENDVVPEPQIGLATTPYNTDHTATNEPVANEQQETTNTTGLPPQKEEGGYTINPRGPANPALMVKMGTAENVEVTDEDRVRRMNIEDIKKLAKRSNELAELQKQQIIEGNIANRVLAEMEMKELSFKNTTDKNTQDFAANVIRAAASHTLNPNQDVIVVTIAVDNNAASDLESQLINRKLMHDMIEKSLDQRLPNGTYVSSVSLKELETYRYIKPFDQMMGFYFNCCFNNNKFKMSAINKEYDTPDLRMQDMNPKYD